MESGETYYVRHRNGSVQVGESEGSVVDYKMGLQLQSESLEVRNARGDWIQMGLYVAGTGPVMLSHQHCMEAFRQGPPSNETCWSSTPTFCSIVDRHFATSPSSPHVIVAFCARIGVSSDRAR